MSDRFPGEIKIGGKIKRKLVPALCKAIAHEGVGLDYGEEGTFDPKDAQDLLDAAKGGALSVCDAEAAYGQFEELEAFLVKNKIAFDRHSDAKYEFNAEEVSYRPDTMTGPTTFGSTSDGITTVTLEELKEKVFPLLQKGEAKAALVALMDMTGSDIPDLEPLSIV